MRSSKAAELAHEQAYVTMLYERLDALRAEALPKRASRDLIMKVAEERWT